MVLRIPEEPMLASTVPVLPEPAAYPGGAAYEPKWAGYRALLILPEDGPAALFSRRSAVLTAAIPEISAAAERDLPPATT